MPRSFRDYLILDGWIPSKKSDANAALRKKILDLKPGYQNGELKNHHVRELKDLIESDPDMYMGFIQMYKEAEPSVVRSTSTTNVHLCNLDTDYYSDRSQTT
jgi:hypothetical protein